MFKTETTDVILTVGAQAQQRLILCISNARRLESEREIFAEVGLQRWHKYQVGVAAL